MTGSGLLGWAIHGGLLVLLISEAVLTLVPYVRQAVEGGIVEAAGRAGTARQPSKSGPVQIEDDQEGQPDP
jgi:hypothetical protein